MSILIKLFAPYSDYTLALPWVVRAIFYQLPPLVKPILVRVCLLPPGTEIPTQRIAKWCYKWKTLKKQLLVNSDDNLWKLNDSFFSLNPIFHNTLAQIVTMVDWNIFSPIFDPEYYVDKIHSGISTPVFPTREELTSKRTTGYYSSEISAPPGALSTDFHSLLLSFFDSTNISSEISSTLIDLDLFDRNFNITQQGFHFLFKSPKYQIQSFASSVLSKPISTGNGNGTLRYPHKRTKRNQHTINHQPTFREILTDWFFRLWFITPGHFYSFPSELFPILKSLASFQLVLLYSNSHVTVTKLFSFLSHPQSHSHLTAFQIDSQSSSVTELHGKLFVETNFKVYCYNPTELQKRLLPLFLDWEDHLEGLSIAIITRTSVRRAMSRGISANSIIEYFEQNIHPSVGILPQVVIEQLHHWEDSRLKIKAFPQATLLTLSSEKTMEQLHSHLLRQRFQVKYISTSEPWQICVLNYDMNNMDTFEGLTTTLDDELLEFIE